MTTYAISSKEVFRSHVDFLLAERREDRALPDRAAAVITWHNGRCVSVRELMDECQSHNAGSSIYEAWAWETAQRVRDVIRTLHETPARALTVYAKHLDLFDISYSAMMDARREARQE